MRQDDPVEKREPVPQVGSQDGLRAAPTAADPARRRFRRAPRPRKKLSEILDAIAADDTRDRVAIADLVQAMHGRAFGALLLVFAVPNALPAIPGTSGILGLPIVILTAQMMLGRAPWLPRFISARGMARADFAVLVGRVNPWLRWADKMTAPRLQWLVEPLAEKLIGLFAFALSLVLVLPIPLGNMLPAFAICLIALGVLERDGLWVLGGIVAGIVAFVVASGVIYAMAMGAWMLVSNAF